MVVQIQCAILLLFLALNEKNLCLGAERFGGAAGRQQGAYPHGAPGNRQGDPVRGTGACQDRNHPGGGLFYCCYLFDCSEWLQIRITWLWIRNHDLISHYE